MNDNCNYGINGESMTFLSDIGIDVLYIRLVNVNLVVLKTNLRFESIISELNRLEVFHITAHHLTECKLHK